jgi:hypothetical protein
MNVICVGVIVRVGGVVLVGRLHHPLWRIQKRIEINQMAAVVVMRTQASSELR